MKKRQRMQMGTKYSSPYSGKGPHMVNREPFRGYGSGSSLRRADDMRQRMLDEAKLLESIGDPRYAVLREAASTLSFASLERIS